MDVAKGAALMSGTSVKAEFITGCYDFLPNSTLSKVLLEKMRNVGSPQYTEKEKAFAHELIKSVDSSLIENQIRAYGVNREKLGFPLCDSILEKVVAFSKGEKDAGSTDVGDVSYCTPTAQLLASCAPIGIPVHSWQFTAAQGSSIGMKGMIFAAKSLSLSILELMLNPVILRDARQEFHEATGGIGYVSTLPENLAPPSPCDVY